MIEKDELTQRKLLHLIKGFYIQLENEEIPSLQLPTRTKANIAYDDGAEVWVYGERESTRSAKTIRGAYQLLKTSYVVDFVNMQLKQAKSSTLRELYYISENWDLAKFREQQESDRLIEDLEIVSELQREDFHIRPEEDGASIMGPIRIREQTRRGTKTIHCQDDVGEAGYQVPCKVDTLEFLGHDAKLVIAIETGGMRDRLIENEFDESFGAIIIHLKGQPARSTRRLMKRMSEELELPVAVFTDGDPWSYRIFASIAYGSIKSAHLSEYMATPGAMFVGIRPSDIINYELPTDKLTDQDIRALHSLLSDPRFDSEFWQSEINLQLELNKKAEQQSLAKYGLDFVTDTYLPERLAEMDIV